MSDYSLPADVVLRRSGHVAKLTIDPFRRRGVLLSVDGVAQSQVNLEDPTDLAFDYIQRMANVVDLFRAPRESIAALHLGAGALSIPRYITHTRPNSQQLVIEWEEDLLDFVERVLPWDSRTISTLAADAREALASLTPSAEGHDLIVVDVFSGNHTPSHLTTLEFYSLLLPHLAHAGVVVINVVDAPDHTFVRSQCRTLQEIFGWVGATGESNVTRGRLVGNLVLVATTSPTPPAWWAELRQMGPHPTGTIEAAAMEKFTHDQAIQADASPLPSPTLSRSVT